jgi:hypothetical protein
MNTTSLPFPRSTVSAFFAVSLGFDIKAVIDDDDDDDAIAKCLI